MSSVTIRPLREQDAFKSYIWRNNKKVFALTTVSYKSEVTLEMELNWIRRVLFNKNEFRFAIEVDGSYVGNIYLTNITPFDGYYHIFIGDTNYWGKGIGFDASLLLLQYAFYSLHLKRVLLDVLSNNTRAIRLYEKLGFKKIGNMNSTIKMVLTLERFLEMPKEPLVSIICLTYNQEKYIKDCIEGFLMQKTSFKFEVLIYDDASSDGTATTIAEYAKRFPDIIKPTFYEKNNFSQGLGYVGLYSGIKEARGRYVAYCEGDDYWTDEQKLQKQVSFLEANPQYAICAHETSIINEDRAQLNGRLFSSLKENMFISASYGHFSFDDSLTGNIFHVSSLMYRNRPIDLPKWINTVSASDLVFDMLLAHNGDIYVLPDVMSTYRGHSNSLTNSYAEYSTAIRFHLLSIRILRLMNRYWKRQYQNKIYPIISRYYVECSMNYLRKSQRDMKLSKDMAHLAWCYDKGTASRFIIKGLASKISSRLCRH